jgi:hypothetical protein
VKVLFKPLHAASKCFLWNQAQAGKHLRPVRLNVRQHGRKFDNRFGKLSKPSGAIS